jgi:hypothetical protein
MGSPFYVGFPELWDQIRPVFDAAARDGVSHDVKEMPMIVERLGFAEETYFTGNFTPVRGETGNVEGFYNAVHEITRLKIGERRREMLAAMEIPALTDPVGFCFMVVSPRYPLLRAFADAFAEKVERPCDPSTLQERGRCSLGAIIQSG